MAKYKVGYFVGSLSSTSINRELSQVLINLAPDDLGTAGGQQSLRAVLSFCNARQMTAPEAYITFSPETFPGDGKCADGSTTSFLTNYMTEFRDHIMRVLTVLPRQP
jgi:chromate reductase, NAD(P)H dehydrogenase (quinone)